MIPRVYFFVQLKYKSGIMNRSQRYITGFWVVWCVLVLGGCHEDVPVAVEAKEVFAIYRVIGHENAPVFDTSLDAQLSGRTRSSVCRKVLFDKGDGFDAMRPENYPLDGLIVADKPLITEDDIISFDWEKQHIHLKPGVKERLPNVDNPPQVWGVPFVVVANGERIYLGAFWSLSSSYLSNMPHISPKFPVKYDPSDKEFLPEDVIRIGRVHFRHSVETTTGPDFNRRLQAAMDSMPYHSRFDERIRSALESVGKLDKP